jgi:integrase
MGAAEVTEFLSYLAVSRQVAASTQNQALAALLFLYRQTLGIDLPWLDNVVRAKRPARLPVVLTKEEVRMLLSQLGQQNWLMASLLYGSGLRLKECLRLRVNRVTMLPVSLLEPLRKHLTYVSSIHVRDLREGFGKVNLPYALAKKYPKANKDWRWQFVFPAAQPSRDPRSKEIYRHHVGEWVLQKAIKDAVAKCRLTKPASCHTLRHSFATHLLKTVTTSGLCRNCWDTRMSERQ